MGDKNAFADAVRGVAQQVTPVPVLLTEYNAGLGIQKLDISYAAAFIFRQVTLLSDVTNLPLYSYWTFSDIFEEGGLSSKPFDSDTFGIQTIHGIPKPAYRALQLLNGASDKQVHQCNIP